MFRHSTAFLLLFSFVSSLNAQATENYLHKIPSSIKEGESIELSVLILQDTPAVQGTLFFRIIGAFNYQEISMIQQGSHWSATIPGYRIISPGIEYVMILDMPMNAKVSVPFGEHPFENPLSISVTEKPIKIQSGSTKQKNSFIQSSDVMILSPEEGSFVRPTDGVIAVSTFNNPNIDTTHFAIFIDEQDYTERALYEQNILSLTPEDLSVGLHTIQLKFMTSYGLEIEPIEWSFTVTKSTSNIIEQFMYRGNINSVISQSSASSISLSEAELNGKISGEMSWIKARLNFRTTSRESEFMQPLNRTTTSLFITDYLKIELGDVYPALSPYIIEGKRVRGQSIDIHLPYFRLQTVTGNLNETVQYQNYTNGGYTLLSENTVNDSTDFTKYYLSRTGYTFPRKIYAGKLSFSIFNKFKAAFHAMKVKDDKYKVSQYLPDEVKFSVDSLGYGLDAGDYTYGDFYSQIMNQNDTLIFQNNNWEGRSPEDNLVMGFDIESAMDNRKLLFQSGWNISLFNTNIWDGEMTLVQMDTILDDSLDGFIGQMYDEDGNKKESSFSPIDTSLIPNPSDYKDLFIININMIPLIPIDIGAMETNKLAAFINMPSSAFYLRLKGHYSINNLLIEYRQIGAQYKTLGNPYLTPNLREFTINNRLSLLDRKLSALFAYQYKDNKISATAIDPLKISKYSMNFTLVPGPGAPSIVVNIQSSKKNNGVDSVSVDADDNFVSDLREKTRSLNTLMSVNIPATFGKTLNNISVSFNKIQYSDILLSVRDPEYFFSKTNSTTMSANISSRFSFPLKSNFSFNQTTLYIPIRDEYNAITVREMKWRALGLSAQYNILNNKVLISSGVNALSSQGTDDMINLYGGSLGLNWSIIKNLSLNFSSNIRLNHSAFYKTDGLDNDSDGSIDEFGESLSVNTSSVLLTLGYKF